MALLVSLALAILAYKMQSLPVMFISSLGWTISGMQIFEQTEEVLPMVLILMLAFGQFFIVKKAGV